MKTAFSQKGHYQCWITLYGHKQPSGLVGDRFFIADLKIFQG